RLNGYGPKGFQPQDGTQKALSPPSMVAEGSLRSSRPPGSVNGATVGIPKPVAATGKSFPAAAGGSATWSSMPLNAGTAPNVPPSMAVIVVPRATGGGRTWMPNWAALNTLVAKVISTGSGTGGSLLK